MAKKSVVSEQKYRVYYDNKTGIIYSVTNEENPSYNYAIEPTIDEVNKLLSGEWSFMDYIVGYKRLADNTVVRSIVPNSDSEYSFRHNSFEWIIEHSNEAELIVEWNLPNKVWNFSLSDEFKKNNNEIFVNKLLFFITLENDFDFLIRTISVDAYKLLDDTFSVSFESIREFDIRSISISSKLVFKSYKLEVVYE